jgi:hypothetical protein
MNDNPYDLAGHLTGERWDVFLSCTRRDRRGPVEVEHALKQAGLRVFRDTAIDEFDGITDDIVRALAGSAVLLAYYSREFPARYACQWELTAAFIAAQRAGDPRDRVLAINPEAPESGHLAPIELADAKFFGPVQSHDELAGMVSRVRDKVRAAQTPLGAFHAGGPVRGLPARVTRSHDFAGRYPQLWAIHTGLNRKATPLVSDPGLPHVALVRGLSGMGKTSLAAQYAFLFQDAFPGGIFWIESLAAAGPEDVRTVFRRELAEIARKLGLGVTEASLDHLRRVVADHLTTEGKQTLWVIDGVPGSLTQQALDELVIPSRLARTVLTSQDGALDWDVATVDLPGLTQDEAAVLLHRFLPGHTPRLRQAMDKVVDGCGGHPMAVRQALRTLHTRQSPASDEDLVARLNEAARSVTGSVTKALSRVSDPARAIVRVAAVLAPAPIPPQMITEVLGVPAEEAAAAADELAAAALLQVVGGAWEVHALVSAACQDDREIPELAAKAAKTVGTSTDRQLVRHALALAAREDLPQDDRIDLFRSVAAGSIKDGDPHSAATMFAELFQLGGGRLDDLIDAARAEIAAGRYKDALAHARQAIERAENDDTYQSAYRARVLAARALDHLWRLSEADELCWNRLSGRPLPGWLPRHEQLADTLALATARRLRGHPKEGLALLEPLLAELRSAPPGVVKDELKPAIQLEYARLLQMTGKSREARQIADEVAGTLRMSGLDNHIRRLEALSILAEATLMLDLTELKATPHLWEWAESELRHLKEVYALNLGAGNLLTLEAAVRGDRALLGIGQPKKALEIMSTTREQLEAVLDADHPLLCRLRHGMGLAHGQLKEFKHQAEIFAEILPLLERRLGPLHPDTLEVRLDFGISLAMCGDRTRAVPLVDSAAQGLTRVLGFGPDIVGRANVARGIVRLPRLVLMGMWQLVQITDRK